jgi:foldase protein PrsA
VPKKRKEQAERVITKGRLSRWQKEQHWQRIIFISVGAIIVIVLGLISYGVYDNASDNDREDNPTVLKVNDQSFKMDYYVKMLRLFGISGYDSSYRESMAQQILQVLENKEIIAKLAPTLGLAVTQEEIDSEIKRQLTPPESSEEESESISPTPTPSYEDSLKQLRGNLNRMGISEKFYRGVISSDLLGKKTQDYIGDRDVAKEMAQANVQGILIDVKAEIVGNDVKPEIIGNEDPKKVLAQIKARLDDGEDFATLAEEFSEDTSSRTSGGDLGWLPGDISSMSYGEKFKEATFSLELGTLSEPIPVSASEDNTQYWLIEVLGREDSRALGEDHKNTLWDQAFSKWLTEQREKFTIEELLDSTMQALAIQKALS